MSKKWQCSRFECADGVFENCVVLVHRIVHGGGVVAIYASAEMSGERYDALWSLLVPASVNASADAESAVMAAFAASRPEIILTPIEDMA